MRAEVWALTDHGEVDIGKTGPSVAHQLAGMVDEDARLRAVPTRVGGRKMHPDIAGTEGAKNGINQGM